MTRLGGTLAVAAVLAAPFSARAQASDVARGIEALARRDIRGAEAAFARGITSSNPQIRATAWQWSAHVAWKVRGDTAAATRHLARALGEAQDSSTVLLELARLHGERRRYSEAVATGRKAFATSLDAERRGLAARTTIALAAQGALAATSRDARDSVTASLLPEIRDTLFARTHRFPGRTSDAFALVQAGILTGDEVAARAGIHSYSRLGGRAPLIVGGSWDSLATAFVAMRLFEPAELVMRLQAVSPSVSRSFAAERAYVAFLRDMGQAATRYNRSVFARSARRGDLDRAFITRGRALWTALHGDRKPYVPAMLRREIGRRFGGVLSIEGADVSELFLAHRFDDAPRAPGDTLAPIILLDGVIANGLDAWLLEEGGGRAGWAARDTVFAIRTAFTETPFRAWLALTDPQTMPGEAFRIARDSAADVERASRDSLDYLPGVAARMFRDGAHRLLDSLAVRGPGEDSAGVRRFTDEVFRALLGSSIVAHERRHLRDLRTAPSISSAEAEFRAKLEEVATAGHPRLALTAILTPRVGDPSSHGQANRRVMLGLNRWIRTNGASIHGYDPASPALLQLPKLTDAQLRDAFASMRKP